MNALRFPSLDDFRIDAELKDEETGPASATFPAVAAAGRVLKESPAAAVKLEGAYYGDGAMRQLAPDMA